MDRQTLVEAVVSIIAVALFLVVIVAVGIFFSSPDSPSLSGPGPFALIGSVAFFVIVMSAAGYWLAGQ